MSIADRIQTARKNSGYTQKDLARVLAVNPTTVSAWEVGRNEPSIDMLKKIASVLGVTFEHLAGIESESKTADLADDSTVFTFEGKQIPPEDLEYMKRILRGGRS